jgi:hypothetical protein
MSFFKTLNIVARALKIEKYKMSDFFQGWGYDFLFVDGWRNKSSRWTLPPLARGSKV